MQAPVPCLNPFEIRAWFGRGRSTRYIYTIGLNPFEIRAWFGPALMRYTVRRGVVLIPLKSGLGSDKLKAARELYEFVS